MQYGGDVCDALMLYLGVVFYGHDTILGYFTLGFVHIFVKYDV